VQQAPFSITYAMQQFAAFCRILRLFAGLKVLYNTRALLPGK
jgi:hypothetical protein